MNEKPTIAAAGNTLPVALAVLRDLSYVVTLTNNGRLCKADSPAMTLVAEDPLQLLGLAKLHDVRGSKWLPTEAEVSSYLAFDQTHTAASGERVDVWEQNGSVHILCVSAFGDPMELGEEEARAFAIRLNQAITDTESR